MLKHVGKHNDRKIVVLFRQVPNEDHMCLVANSDLLPRLVHDEIMKVLESPSGQAAENLADALFRNVMADGRNTLEVLHKEGFIKKVPTNQVIMTPTSKAKVRLDELNDMLNEMAKGEEAIKRLAEMDANVGMTGKMNKNRVIEGREVGVPSNSRSKPAAMPVDSVLTDEVLAEQRKEQAEKMRASAQQLLAEAERLMGEAESLKPTLKPKTNAKKKAVKADQY
jgi:hypothetical protein